MYRVVVDPLKRLRRNERECCLATEGPITIGSGQAELNLREIPFGRGEKRDWLHQGPVSEQAANDKNKTSDFIAYPTNKVVGFIDDLGDAQAALSDLRASGFAADEIEVLVGEEGAQRIDVNGGEHGVLAHMVRSILKALGGYEIPHAERHEQELLAGHFGIGVTAKQEEDRKKVRGILKSHNGHFINFYGAWTMEKLEP
jgi:hypothetical protein